MVAYFGAYMRFETVSKSEAGLLLSADNMVGDIYDIELRMEGGEYTGWLINRFGKTIGFFGPEDSRELALKQAQGLELKAILSFVAFTEGPDEGQYWGQMAVIGYDPAYADAFALFIKNIAKKMADGVRLRVDLGQEAVENVIEQQGEWVPTQSVPLPEPKKGTAILKDHQRMLDKLIEQGRSGNKGCYVASWALMLAFVALVVYVIVVVF